MAADVQVWIADQLANPSIIARPLSVTHGRSDITTQPEAPSTDIEWLSATCPWKVGDRVVILGDTQYVPAVYDDPVVTYDDPRALYDSDTSAIRVTPHFDGIVAGIEAVSALGQVQAWNLNCVGGMARLGFTPILLTRPVESDVARVQAIGAAVGIQIVVLGPVGVNMAAATIDSDALSALHDVCLSTGGLLWQDRGGVIIYGTAGHRLAIPDPIGVIPTSVIQSDLSWLNRLEDIVNEVAVSWGPEDARETVVHQDLDSQAQPWGVRRADINSGLATETDADQLALLILARRAWPFWGASTAVLDLPDNGDTSRLFASLDVSTPVLVPIPREPGPAPGDLVPVVVEGWIETWTEGMEHTAEAALSDQRRWVTTSVRDYAEVLAGGDYGFWRADDYLNMLVKGVTP